MKVEPGNILKLFLNFSNFEPKYSYRLYSYKKKECRFVDSTQTLYKKVGFHPHLCAGLPQGMCLNDIAAPRNQETYLWFLLERDK